jgi:type IV pilus assembly protein PilX
MLQKKQKIKAGCYTHAISSQRGVVLLVALVMLFVMTLMGITTMSGATLQERMSGNNRQQIVARINAEAALRAGQAFLEGLGVDGIVKASDFESLFLAPGDELYMGLSTTDIIAPAPHGLDVTNPDDWADANSLVAGLAMNNAANPPRYIIEYIGRYFETSTTAGAVVIGEGNAGTDNLQPFIFRIIGVGWGQNQNVFSVLQATYMTIQGSKPI